MANIQVRMPSGPLGYSSVRAPFVFPDGIGLAHDAAHIGSAGNALLQLVQTELLDGIALRSQPNIAKAASKAPKCRRGDAGVKMGSRIGN
jgi:hypothetical protein